MANSNLQNRLSRLGSQLFGTTPSSRQPNLPIANLPARYTKLAAALSGNIIQRTAGSFCIVDASFNKAYEHGSLRLSDIFSSSSVAVSSFTRTSAEGSIALERLRFIDTETTGLGGSGIIPFLIGVGKIADGNIHVRQFFLPDYSDEAGMLEAVCEELPEGSVLVSYNGIAFDLPALVSRCIVNRVAASLDTLAHYDLLHSVRRLFKRRLKDCSLQNIEREVLGFMREDDIPGFLIPGTYFDWLSEENTEPLRHVIAHNRFDIVSLPFLAGFIAEIFAGEGEMLSDIDDIHSLSRTYGIRGERHISHRLFERMKQMTTDTLADDLLLYHANNCKRLGDYSEALILWQRVANSEGRPAASAAIELAKYHEHTDVDFAKALIFARQAQQSALLTKTQKAALEKRILRLGSKISVDSAR